MTNEEHLNNPNDYGESDQRPPTLIAWYQSRLGVGLLIMYSVLGMLCLLLVSGVLYPSVITIEIAGVIDTHPFVTPIQLYLYTMLGALGYIFGTLTENPDASPLGVFHIGLRIPAALLVTTGVFLFSSTLGFELQNTGVTDERTLAGMAFLVGLFVDHALRSLRAISSRLYPGEPQKLYVEISESEDTNGESTS